METKKVYETTRTYYMLEKKAAVMAYEPVEPDERAKVAIIIMHGVGNWLTRPIVVELAKHGYRVFGSNPVHSAFTDQMQDLSAVIDFAKSRPGVEKVVLFGQSRGASLASSYQKIAENGVKIFQGPERLLPFPDIPQLTPADGLMILDSNYGIMSMLSLDAAIIDEAHPMRRDPELDSLNPANGYDPNGSHYSDAFIRKYQSAQAIRYKKLLKLADERLHLIESGRGSYSDNEPFIIANAHGSYPNKLFMLDNRLLSHTRGQYPLIHPDGSITTQVVPSVRLPQSKPDAVVRHQYALYTTVREFLLAEVKLDDDFGYGEDSFWGVDWKSCFTCACGNTSDIHVPFLTMGMTGGYEYMAAEYNYENSASSDKTIAFVEGGSHDFITAHETEKFPGQWGDTCKTTADYVQDWIDSPGRFFD